MVYTEENLESHHQERQKKAFQGCTEIISNTIVSEFQKVEGVCGRGSDNGGENNIVHSYKE